MKAFTSNTIQGRVPYFEGYTFIGIGQPADGEYYLSNSGSLYKYIYIDNPIYAIKNGICYSRDKPAPRVIYWMTIDELDSDTVTISPGQILLAQEKKTELFFKFYNSHEKIEVELPGTTYSRYSLMESI